jgi:hypothetical protein
MIRFFFFFLRSFQNLICSYCICPVKKNVVADFLSCPNQTTTGSVAAKSAADPEDFEEMAAKQNRYPETQRLLGGTSRKLAFRQTGAQAVAKSSKPIYLYSLKYFFLGFISPDYSFRLNIFNCKLTGWDAICHHLHHPSSL